jgi:tetratricopeptide (TPR) repeat protein
MQLNPFYTWDYLYNLGRAYYTLGQYEAAIDALEQARGRNENALPVKLFLTASYIKNGQQEDAEWEAEQIQMLSPMETISHTKQTIPVVDEKLMESFLEDLRKAGLPE